jgi:peptide/nickel transport system substrate-binding protein
MRFDERRLRATAILAAAAVCASLAACGGSDDKEYAENGTYTEPLNGDPGNLNPLQAVTQNTQAVTPFAYDSLINIDSEGEVVPQLAERWETTPTRVTFTLRKGVTCSDGAPLTASDVARTFEYIRDPKNGSPQIGTAIPTADFTVRADDAARAVTIELAKPYAFLVQGAGLVPIVCPKGLDDVDALAQETQGTGPFVLEEAVADDHLTFVRRDDYEWGPNGATTAEPGFPQEVVFRIVKDPTTAANLVLSGEMTSIAASGAVRERLAGQGYDEVDSEQGPYDLWFNQRPGRPTADPDVRRALAQALDVEELAKVTTEGTGVSATNLTVLPPSPCPGDTVQGAVPSHDPAAAAELLDQAGWTPGADGIRARDGERLELTLLYPSLGPGVSAGMELVAGQWRDLGVDVKLQMQSTNAFTETLYVGSKWDVAWLSFTIGYPSEIMATLTDAPSPDGSNYAAISNPEYARLSAEALGKPGPDGCELWHEAERALFENVDLVPVATNRVSTFVRDAELVSGVFGTEPTSIRLFSG